MVAPTIIGHAQQRAELERDLAQGNLTHAYVFAGPEHIGKSTIARWFAKELLLTDVPEERKEEIARQIDCLIHPDFMVLDQLWIEGQCEDWNTIAKHSNVPQQHRSKAPKLMKTNTISIDDVRVLQERLVETGSSKYLVCVITSLERMRDEAANAFLKMLEEPPPGRIFLLTTDNLENVLPTVVSRTRIVRFQRVGTGEMASLLKECDTDTARFILHAAQGAPGIALSLRDDPDALRIARQRHEQAKSVWASRTLAQRLKLLKPLLERGKEADAYLLHLALALREEPEVTHAKERALAKLVASLQTNGHRELLVQRFGMNIEN